MQPVRRILSLCILTLFAGAALAQPTADFSATPVSGCAGLAVQFTDASTGTVSSYSWTLGNGATSILQNPSTTYANPGSYDVTLTVTGPGGFDTKFLPGYITIYDKPTVSFSATTTSGCVPYNVQFNSIVTANSGGPISYAWDFGDGLTGSGASPTHNYTTPGTYNVSLTVTNGAGCVRTVTQNNYITIHPPPTTNFTASQLNFCSTPATVSFTNTSTGLGPITASWTFGNGFNGTGNTPTTTYTTGGTFPVVLTATDARGCMGTAVNVVSVVATQPQFSTPTFICPGDSALFINTTTGNTSSRWNFGDGDTGVGSPIRHVFPPSGSFNVTLTTRVGQCTLTYAKTISISPKPSATITQSPSIPCPKPVTVTFTANSPLATSYDWKWQSGGIASGQTVNNYYPGVSGMAPYIDSVRLITTSAAGCKDTVWLDTIKIRPLTVYVLPGGSWPPRTAGCVPLTLNFGTIQFEHMTAQPQAILYPVPAVAWAWDFGDGGTGTGATPTHTFTQTGDDTVRCIVTTANGCSDTGYLFVHIDTPVHPSFYGFPLTPICPKDTVTFINTTDTPLVGTTYTWYSTGTGFVQRSDTSSVRLGFLYPGTYNVHLVTDHRGCRDTFTRYLYITVNPPGSMFHDSIYCPPSTTVDFTNNSYLATSHLWDFGDGTTSTTWSPSHTYTLPGIYVARLTTHNSTYGCRDTLTDTLIVKSPILDFIADDEEVCNGTTVRFLPLFVGNRAVQLKYSFRTENITPPFDTGKYFYHQYTTKGHHDVTMYSMSGKGHCIDSLTKTAFIGVSQPIVNFGANPRFGCQPLAVTFIDSTVHISGVSSSYLEWTFGDGNTFNAGAKSASNLYTTKGTYSVKLAVTDSYGCRDSLTKPNYIVVRRPVADYTAADTAVCAKQLVSFTSLANPPNTLQHRWDFGDGDTSAVINATHRYASPGTYNVRLVVTDSFGCTDTLLRNGYMKVKAPLASFTVDDSVAACPPLLARFANTSIGAVSNVWDLGTGATLMNIDSPSKTYVNNGIYKIQLVAIDADNCTDTATGTVRVLGYNGAFSYNTVSGCVPLTVNFSTPINGVSQYLWDFSDGTTTLTGTNTSSHTYTNPGVYMPRLIFSDGPGCSSLSTGLDSIRVDKLVAGFTYTVPCVNAAFTLSDSSYAFKAKANSWLWLFGATDTGRGAPIAYVPPSTGLMQVTLIVGNSVGCLDTITKTVFVNELPIVDAGLDTNVCPGDTIRLVANGARSYSWTLPPVSSLYLSCSTCAISYFSPATHSETVIHLSGTDSNGCVGRDSVTVKIQVKTTTSTAPGGEICIGESFRLHAAGAQSYVWLPFGTIDSPFIASPLATPTTTTTYIVAAREGSCLVDSQSVTVVVHPLPPFDAGYDQFIHYGSAAILEPTQNGIHHIIWRSDTTLSCLDCFNPAAFPPFTRTYWATAYNEWGCFITDSVTVHVRCNGDSVYIPNTFTPNGDGRNDYFFPRGKGIEKAMFLRVFDRWGELVYERTGLSLNDERSGWDGSYRGRALPPDTYVYVMQSRCITGELVRWKGDINLVR